MFFKAFQDGGVLEKAAVLSRGCQFYISQRGNRLIPSPNIPQRLDF